MHMTGTAGTTHATTADCGDFVDFGKIGPVKILFQQLKHLQEPLHMMHKVVPILAKKMKIEQ